MELLIILLFVLVVAVSVNSNIYYVGGRRYGLKSRKSKETQLSKK